MDNQNSPILLLTTIVSALLGITLRDIQVAFSIVASMTAIISGILAGRYYYNQIKKLK